MAALNLTMIGGRQVTMENLKGLRAEGYIRDSRKDQRDGAGPDIQRNHIQRFAETYQLALGSRWYIEFVSSYRHWERRSSLLQFITYEVATAWGFKTVKPEHLALILG